MIQILDEFPVILTKDVMFKPKQVAKSGAIILLPQDAVLVIAKSTKENR